MTWFKVDDSFWRSGKVRRLGEKHRVGCVGLWTLSGDWSADNLTDGFVPWEVIEQWDPDRILSERLIAVGLWVETERVGETGAIFHDWEDWQPTREQVEQRRKADTERRARWREKRAASRGPSGPDGGGGGAPDPGADEHDVSRNGSRQASRSESRQASRPASRRDSRRDSADQQEREVSRRDSRVSSRGASRQVSALPDPTRPDPTRPDPLTTSSEDLGGGSLRTERARCARHAGLPADDPGPDCVGCRDVRLAAIRSDLDALDAEAEARATDLAVRDDCPLCDEWGMVVGDPDDRDTPVRRCTHDQPAHLRVVS